LTAGQPPLSEVKPLQAWLRQLRGTVYDPAGAIIANVEIEVYVTGVERRGPLVRLRTDNVGNFTSQLEPGEYVVAFKSPGFVYQRVAVSIGLKGWQGMQLNLGIGNNCGGMGSGSKSTIAGLR
jgi:hypothetical protein